jgi:glutaredoxin
VILRRAIYAAALVLVSIFACSSQPPNPNSARVTVTYNDNLVSERNEGWNSFKELNAYMQKPIKKFIVFGARWCGPCKFVRRLVNQMNFKYQIMWIDIDTKWGELLWRQLGVGSVPIMVEADELDRQVGMYENARDIVMRLMLVE